MIIWCNGCLWLSCRYIQHCWPLVSSFRGFSPECGLKQTLKFRNIYCFPVRNSLLLYYSVGQYHLFEYQVNFRLSSWSSHASVETAVSIWFNYQNSRISRRTALYVLAGVVLYRLNSAMTAMICPNCFIYSYRDTLKWLAQC